MLSVTLLIPGVLLSDELKKQDFDETVLIKAGLVKKNKDGGLYDVFRDRLIFPIRDRKGRVVGFGGRVMNPEDQPKYLNTGDTPVFQKGKELYGLYESLENRRDLKRYLRCRRVHGCRRHVGK